MNVLVWVLLIISDDCAPVSACAKNSLRECEQVKMKKMMHLAKTEQAGGSFNLKVLNLSTMPKRQLFVPHYTKGVYLQPECQMIHAANVQSVSWNFVISTSV